MKHFLSHFVLIAPEHGAYETTATSFGDALKRLRKRVGPKAEVTVFASTAPMNLEFDVYARVYAVADHPLCVWTL